MSAKILQLSYRVPYPPNDGGAIGISNITKGLHDAGCDVDLLSINTPKHFQPEYVLSSMCRQYNVFVNTNISPFKLLINLFKDIPYNAERFISKDFESKLTQLLQINKYDIVQAEGIFTAPYISTVRKYSSTPAVVRAHNVEHVIWERLSENESNPLKQWYFGLIARRMKRFEREYYNSFDAVAAITKEDEKRLRDLGVTVSVRVIPAGVILDRFKTDPSIHARPKTICSISAFDWMPNVEAVFWFLEKVWPKLSKRVPELELHIAGKSTPPEIAELKIRNVFVHGMVPDAPTFMQQYSMMVVPLLSGGGMRLKIIEAMALGKCIVSSKIGAEGIDYNNGQNVLICDTPDEWVEIISSYIKDDEAVKRIGYNAGILARKRYDNMSVTNEYLSLYRSLKKL